MGRGSFPSLKMVCQPTSGRKEDSTLDPTCAVGRASLVGSRMTIPLDARGGGVFGGASPEPLGVWSIVRCLFWERTEGGGEGVWLLPWGSCDLISLWSVSASEEFTDSTASCSAGWTWAWGSSIGLWTARLWKTISVEASLIGINDFALAI